GVLIFLQPGNNHSVALYEYSDGSEIDNVFVGGEIASESFAMDSTDRVYYATLESGSTQCQVHELTLASGQITVDGGNGPWDIGNSISNTTTPSNVAIDSNDTVFVLVARASDVYARLWSIS